MVRTGSPASARHTATDLRGLKVALEVIGYAAAIIVELIGAGWHLNVFGTLGSKKSLNNLVDALVY